MERSPCMVEFEQLNALGKAVFVAGVAAHAGKGLLKRFIQHVARIAVESKRAFEQGLDPQVEEARVLEERLPGEARQNRDAPEASCR